MVGFNKLPTKFVVKQDDKQIEFKQEELFAFLFERLQANYPNVPELQNVEDYVKSIFSLFSDEIVTESNFKELFTLFFLSGFYYSNFFSKNDVQIIQEEQKE